MASIHQVNCVRQTAGGWRAGLLACVMAAGAWANLHAGGLSEQIFTPASPINAPAMGMVGWDPFSDVGGAGNQPLTMYFWTGEGMTQVTMIKGTVDGEIEWAADGSQLTVFAPGETIDGLISWSAHQSYPEVVGSDPLVQPGESLYFGYRLFDGEQGSDYASYGWIELTNVEGTIYLSRWAINYSEGGITVPMGEAIPEPSTYAAILGAVALGGALVMRRRKLKSAADAA